MNTSLNEIKNIVTCANYLNKTCYYGRHCKFLHYSLHPKVINNEQTIHNEPNQNNKIHFTKQQQQQKNLNPNKKQTQINNQQVELKEQLTQLLKQESIITRNRKLSLLKNSNRKKSLFTCRSVRNFV